MIASVFAAMSAEAAGAIELVAHGRARIVLGQLQLLFIQRLGLRAFRPRGGMMGVGLRPACQAHQGGCRLARLSGCFSWKISFCYP